MNCYNKKRKPKHWTKPKWKTRATKTSKVIAYFLVTRGLKNKYKEKEFFSYTFNNQPKIEFLSKNRMIAIESLGDFKPMKIALKKAIEFSKKGGKGIWN